jgi:hypothetical protein
VVGLTTLIVGVEFIEGMRNTETDAMSRGTHSYIAFGTGFNVIDLKLDRDELLDGAGIRGLEEEKVGVLDRSGGVETLQSYPRRLEGEGVESVSAGGKEGKEAERNQVYYSASAA